jgi:uncharacterized protein
MIDNKIKTVIQICILFVFPILLIYFGVIPVQYRFFVLLTITIIVTFIILSEKWSLQQLGVRRDNIKKSILPYAILTIVATVTTVVLARLLGNNTPSITNNIHFQYGFIVLSFLQEYLFRSFLIPKLKLLTSSPTLVIISNAILFGILHLIYPNTLVSILLTAILGVSFAYVYYYRPNLILATIAHSIINFIAVFYCFVSFGEGC